MRRSDIVIREPCRVDWERMRRLEQKRYCEACEKHVHDLSVMTEAEARRLLASPPTSGLCVRYLYDEAGNVVFRPERLVPGAALVRARRLAVAAAAAVLPFGLAACGGSRATMGRPVMGDVEVAPTPTAPDGTTMVTPELPEVGPAPSGSHEGGSAEGCAVPPPQR